MLSSLELCAGSGGQALGLEQAGFEHQALVEIEVPACQTLKLNRPNWQVNNCDISEFSGKAFKGIDLLAAGVPCPPFSRAGKQLGSEDERDLFPEVIRLVDECTPSMVMIENVRGLLDAVFEDYRKKVDKQLKKLGYETGWKLLNASDYGVSQLRPRVIFVGVKKSVSEFFEWPIPLRDNPETVGELLFDLMKANKWRGAKSWRDRADSIAPTLVGGSKKHGGPDLGPTRAKKAWASLGVDAHGLVDEAPEMDFVGMPRLTTRMTARLQGFDDSWNFFGKKTPVYRQIGNAFPPPVAKAIGVSLAHCLRASNRIHKVG